MKPYMKYVGGKQGLMDQLVPLLPDDWEREIVKDVSVIAWDLYETEDQWEARYAES